MVLILGGLACACMAAAGMFDPCKAGFQVHYGNETSPYTLNSVFLMPGEILRLEVSAADSGRFLFTFAAGSGGVDSGGKVGSEGPRSWTWTAPDSSGVYALELSRSQGRDAVRFNAFVKVPAAEMKGEYLGGYRIGTYPPPIKKTDFYLAPKGYIKLDAAAGRIFVSPHFRLGQFACKQCPDLPAYLVLKERLILKLELLLDKVNEAGYACNTFHIMSGYRTPYYNRLIGNVTLSAHQFGGAADIFIDADPEDGVMDDLNRDGISDQADADVLIALIDAVSRNETFAPYLGGIGRYDKTADHGPFVHVDVRGFRVLW